jgi:hypothetical protein
MSEVMTMPTTSKPHATPPRNIVWLVRHAAPPTPACFDSDEQWQSYLISLAASGERITRRQDTGKWTTVDGKKIRTERTVTTVFTRIDYCQDCPIGSAAQVAKRQAGRCIMPPLPYRTQIALFDAQTDTLVAQMDKVAAESARRKEASRLEKAAAYLRAHGFELKAPSVVAWMFSGKP